MLHILTALGGYVAVFSSLLVLLAISNFSSFYVCHVTILQQNYGQKILVSVFVKAKLNAIFIAKVHKNKCLLAFFFFF